MVFVPTPHYVVPTTLYDVIKHLGIESELQFVVDAGDAASVALGSNQTLGTLPTGGSTFTLGPNTSVDTDTDAQHVGTPGRQSVGEYWSTQVNASVTASQRLETPRTTWSDNAHKNNALFTFAGWFYIPTALDGALLFDTEPFGLSNVGISILITDDNDAVGADHPAMVVHNGSGSAWALEAHAASLSISNNVPFFVALSQDEAAGSLRFALNGDQEVVAGTYSSPSSSNSTRNCRVYCVTSESPAVSGRVYNAAWWNRALSGAELTSLYNAQKGKFGH